MYQIPSGVAGLCKSARSTDCNIRVFDFSISVSICLATNWFGIKVGSVPHLGYATANIMHGKGRNFGKWVNLN